MERKVAKKRRRKRRNGLFSKIIVFAFVIYSVATLISLQVQINDKNEEKSILQVQIEEKNAEKAQLSGIIDEELDEEYIISEAQKQGYAAPNERVFVDVSGQ